MRFKCLQCGTKFKRETWQVVECPSCHSHDVKRITDYTQVAKELGICGAIVIAIAILLAYL